MNKKTVSDFLRMGSEEQKEFMEQVSTGSATLVYGAKGIDKNNPMVASREKQINVKQIARGKYPPVYSARILGGFELLLANGSWKANHPKIADCSFEFEFGGQDA